MPLQDHTLEGLLQEATSLLRNDPYRTIELSTVAETLAVTANDSHAQVRAALLLSRACIHTGSAELGETHARRAFSIASKVHDVLGLGRSMNELGIYCFVKSQFDEAIQHYSEAEKLLRSVDATEEVAKVLLNVGNVHTRKGDYASALTQYEQCLEMAEELHDVVLEAKVLTNMTPFFEMLIYDSDTAFDYARKTIDVFLRLGDVVGLAKAYSNMAAYQRREGNPELAVEYSMKAMDLRKNFTESIDILADYYGLTSALVMMNDLTRAREVIDAGLARSKTLPDSPGTLYVQLAHAKVLLEEGRAQESLDIAIATTAAMHALGIDGDATEAEVLVADASSVLGQFERSSSIYQKLLVQRMADARNKMEYRLSFIRSRYEIRHSKSLAEIERLRNVELAEAVRRLEELIAQKSEYLAFIAHELKNPLSTIRSIAALLSADRTMVESERLELTGQIVSISSRMFDLITSLLERSKNDQQSPHAISIINAATVWEHVIQQASYAAREKSITIESHADANSYPVYATEQYLVTIAGNLLSNAIKFSPMSSAVTIIIRQTQSTTGNGKPVVQLCVRDQGPGVPDDELSLLFTPFQRLSTSPTGGEHSSGLGLHIVKRDVERLAGHVWCESTIGQGASFFVELPLAIDDSEQGPLTIVRKTA